MNRVKWIFIGTLIAFAAAAYLNRDALRSYQQQAAAKEAAEQRLRKAELERANLLEQNGELETSIGQEKQARKSGYRKPGEKPLFGP